jgi:hypothetical protein
MDYSFGHRFGINLKLVGYFFFLVLQRLHCPWKTVFSDCDFNVLKLLKVSLGHNLKKCFRGLPRQNSHAKLLDEIADSRFSFWNIKVHQNTKLCLKCIVLRWNVLTIDGFKGLPHTFTNHVAEGERKGCGNKNVAALCPPRVDVSLSPRTLCFGCLILVNSQM